MITNIWLKSQPNKKIAYPDCKPEIYTPRPHIEMDRTIIVDMKDNTIADYKNESVSRVEFRP